jgi:hypothetical protein
MAVINAARKITPGGANFAAVTSYRSPAAQSLVKNVFRFGSLPRIDISTRIRREVRAENLIFTSPPLVVENHIVCDVAAKIFNSG